MDNCEFLLKDVVPNLNEQVSKELYIYYELLKEETKKYNLTSITEYQEVYIKHFYDSLLIGKVVDLDHKKIADIGTGAGFPGLVLAIVYPTLSVTLIEPTTKRCNFLKLVADTLKLNNVTIINERAEKLDNTYRHSFDYVTARAVSNLQILLELLTPYLKVDGNVIALKGSNIEEELKQAQNAMQVLHLTSPQIFEFELPLQMGKRNILVFQKKTKTLDIYPREYAKIKNKPL